jgi:hypothetical protein
MVVRSILNDNIYQKADYTLLRNRQQGQALQVIARMFMLLRRGNEKGLGMKHGLITQK